MKKVFCLILITAMVLTLSSCLSIATAEVPEGAVAKYEFYQEDAFMDSADFCYYVYESDAPFKDNKDYSKVRPEDFNNINGYFKRFTSALFMSDRKDHFLFDSKYITEGDYWYLETAEGTTGTGGNIVYGKYDHFKLCYFDTESNILFFIHMS